MSDKIGLYRDPHSEGNSSKYLTGHLCIESECNYPAGTAWSPYWCFRCNIIRMDRITNQLETLVKSTEHSARGKDAVN